MPNQIKQINFKYFRGLPVFGFKLKKPNLLLYAGNGKGKSSIVQGIEWLFNGSVEHLDENCIRHIDAPEDINTSVEVIFGDGSTVKREFSPESAITGQKNGLDYIREHPSSDSFILRRSKLLHFMEERPGERYHRVISLMSLDWVNDLQDTFEKSLQLARDQKDKVENKIRQTYNKYKTLSSGKHPDCRDDIFLLCNEKLADAKLKTVHNISDIKSMLSLIKDKRNTENQKLLLDVEGAIAKLENIEDLYWDEKVASLNKTRSDIRRLQSSIISSDQFSLLTNAMEYFTSADSLESCPICERNFDIECTYSHVLERLSKRVNDLSELNSAHSANQKQTANLERDIQNEASNLFRTLKSVLKIEQLGINKDIETEYTSILQHIKQLYSENKKERCDDFNNTPAQESLNYTKREALIKLNNIKKELTKSSPTQIEECYNALHSAAEDIPILTINETKFKNLLSIESTADLILRTFKQSKNHALETVLNEISHTVKKFYDYIHSDDTRDEYSECTAVSMTPKSQGRGSGTLQFSTDFFDKIIGCDPRHYLSEGHLDSLGLCIYLASVKHFNSKKTLLVLDDVLTSVDKDHRHRVTDLIFEEFKEYQIIITTHDDVWFQQMMTRINSFHKEQWSCKKIEHWSRSNGPIDQYSDLARKALKIAIQSGNIKTSGGAIRILTEELCQKTAETLNLRIPYKRSGEYTLPVFSTNGLGAELINGINRVFTYLEKEATEATGELSAEQKENLHATRQMYTLAVEKVIGFAFMNKLAHKKVNLEEVPDTELRDFAENLLKLHEYCCNKKTLLLMQ